MFDQNWHDNTDYEIAKGHARVTIAIAVIVALVVVGLAAVGIFGLSIFLDVIETVSR